MIASFLTIATVLGLAVAAPSPSVNGRDISIPEIIPEIIPAQPNVIPELIPGEGLPSLASVNLTTEELHAWPEALDQETGNQLVARFDPGCGPEDRNYAHVVDMIPCYNFLNALGDYPCRAPENNRVVQFASYGSARVLGQSLITAGTTSSCRDVAHAVLWAIDHCTRPDQTVAGFEAARGNGNLIAISRNVFT